MMPRDRVISERTYSFRLPDGKDEVFEAAAKKRGMNFSAFARELVLRGLKDA